MNTLITIVQEQETNRKSAHTEIGIAKLLYSVSHILSTFTESYTLLPLPGHWSHRPLVAQVNAPPKAAA